MITRVWFVTLLEVAGGAAFLTGLALAPWWVRLITGGIIAVLLAQALARPGR